MLCAAILFTRKDRGAAHDDKISIISYNDSTEIFEVVYHNPEVKRDRVFLASFSGVLTYVEDVLTSMRHDVDPFENIQLNSSIHPAILFHVSDMDESVTRDLLVNMVRDAMRFHVTTNE
jgi:hypothetical protein